MQTRYERWLNRMGKIILYDPERRFAGLGDSFPAGETAEHRTLHTFTAEDQLLFYLEEGYSDCKSGAAEGYGSRACKSMQK